MTVLCKGKPRQFQCIGCAYENMWSPLHLETGMCFECERWLKEWKEKMRIKREERFNKLKKR